MERRKPRESVAIVSSSSSPIGSIKLDLSTVATWVTLTTDVLGNAAVPLAKTTFPGAAPSRRFEVSTTTTTVAIALRMYLSAEHNRRPDQARF